MNIAQNVRHIREQMAEAAIRSGRDPHEIRLCAATKMNSSEAIRQAISAGVDICAENRVQELVEKLALGAYADVPLHLIGHLQKNKARLVVGRVAVIESVDSLELMDLLNRLAARQCICQDILLEVKLADEPGKTGFSPDEVFDAAAHMQDLSSLRLRGLMAIPPVQQFQGQNRPFFAKMNQLFIDMKLKTYHNASMDCLSMGMSNDFCDAIAEGATLVRLGTAIFGPRSQMQPQASDKSAPQL